jgi:hypothetical protein
MDGSAINADGDGRPIRSAQAIDASEDFGLWTTWTAFPPSILRIRRTLRVASLYSSWDVPSALYATIITPPFLKREEPSKASKPSIEQ